MQRFDILAVDLLGPAFFSLEMLTAAAAGQHGAVRALSPQPCAPADTSALSQRAGGSASPHYSRALRWQRELTLLASVECLALRRHDPRS